MALTTGELIRLRIQDQPLRVDAVYNGDGTANSFALPHRNLTSGTAYVPVAAGWSATGSTFNATGFVEFSGVISANSAFRTVYVHSVFSDDEIGEWITAQGSVNGAALEAVHTLMFDSTKRARWGAPDGTQYDDTMGMQALRDLHSALKAELAGDAIAAGSMPSWGLNQELY